MARIKELSKPALAVFNAITTGIEKVGDHRKIDSERGYMPVVVEAIGTSPHGGLIISIAHYYEQNGDLMADPEITFIITRPDFVMPASYKQDGLGIDRQYIEYRDGKITFYPAAQNDLAGFCSTWMRNIKEQQYGGKLPKLAVA